MYSLLPSVRFSIMFASGSAGIHQKDQGMLCALAPLALGAIESVLGVWGRSLALGSDQIWNRFQFFLIDIYTHLVNDHHQNKCALPPSLPDRERTS